MHLVWDGWMFNIWAKMLSAPWPAEIQLGLRWELEGWAPSRSAIVSVAASRCVVSLPWY